MTKPPTSESSAAAGAVLLPCPWCLGMDARHVGRCIECTSCGASGPEMARDATSAEYIHVWNSRSTPQPPPEAGSVGVPAGFVLVPRVPTKEMLDAACASQDRGDWIGGFYFARAWPHMLAAAPAPKESK